MNCHLRESFTNTCTVTIQFIQAVGSSRTAYTYWSEDRLHVKAESNSSLLNYDMPFSKPPFTAFCASFSFRQSLDQLISSFNLTELTLRQWQLNSSEHNVSEFHILELLTLDGLIIKCRECLQLSELHGEFKRISIAELSSLNLFRQMGVVTRFRQTVWWNLSKFWK